MFGDETKFIEIPSDFSTIGFRVWNGSNGRRIDESKRRDVGSSSKVPLIVSKVIGRWERTRFRVHIKGVNSSSGDTSHGLDGRFP